MTTWQKIVMWIKISLGGIGALYLLLLVFNNLSPRAELWFAPFVKRFETPVLLLAIVSFFMGAILGILTWTTIKSMRKMKTVVRPSEREIAEMVAKAQRLQTRASEGL